MYIYQREICVISWSFFLLSSNTMWEKKRKRLWSSAISHSPKWRGKQSQGKSRSSHTGECRTEENEVNSHETKSRKTSSSCNTLDRKLSCWSKCQTKQIAKPFLTQSAVSGLPRQEWKLSRQGQRMAPTSRQMLTLGRQWGAAHLQRICCDN